jgi:sortase (surface protein transpeptidase)
MLLIFIRVKQTFLLSSFDLILNFATNKQKEKRERTKNERERKNKERTNEQKANEQRNERTKK